MPHIILEYSASLKGAVDIDAVLVNLHEALAGQGIDIARIKTRGIAYSHTVVADKGADGQMAHVTLQLLEGRDVDTRKTYAAALYDVLVQRVQGQCPECKVTLDVREMCKDTYCM